MIFGGACHQGITMPLVTGSFCISKKLKFKLMKRFERWNDSEELE